MKRLLLAIGAVVFLAGRCPADSSLTPLASSLIDHVHAQTVFDVRGVTRLELTDSVFMLAPYKGFYLLEGQAGFSGTTVPQPGESVYGHFIVSAFFRVDPFLKGTIIFPENYAFLRSVEYGPVYGYDFEQRHGYLGFQANLAFGLNPIR